MFLYEDICVNQVYLCSIALIILSYCLWTRRHLYLFAYKIPGYWGLPFIGIIYKIRSIDNFLKVVHECFQVLNQHTYCMWVGLRPIMFTRDPILVGKILASNDVIDRAHTMSHATSAFLGQGLLVTEGHQWEKNRKLINLFFKQKMMLNFLPAFNNAKNKAIKMLANYQTGREEWILPVMHRVLLSSAVETLLNENLPIDSEDLENYAKNAELCKIELARKMSLSFVKLDFLYSFSKNSYEIVKKFLHNRITKSIEASGGIVTNSKIGKKLPFNDIPNNFLDYGVGLYEAQQISEKELCDEIHTLIETLYDTTGSTLFSTLLLLAIHPDVQQRLYNELMDVFPDKSFEVKQKHLTQLTYLNMVINESLRIMPSVPFIARRVIRDTQLDNLKLPRDLDVTVCLYDLHRCKEIWGPDADSFDPDRFLPELAANLQPNSFVPFSKGVRGCIGFRYALFALKIIVAGLVRNYEFKTSCKMEDIRTSATISIYFPKKPLLQIFARE